MLVATSAGVTRSCYPSKNAQCFLCRLPSYHQYIDKSLVIWVFLYQIFLTKIWFFFQFFFFACFTFICPGYEDTENMFYFIIEDVADIITSGLRFSKFGNHEFLTVGTPVKE